MTRDEILQTALQLKTNNICLELSTGTGKTKIALNITKKRLEHLLIKNILIVIPKLILKEEWIKEIHKWKMDNLLPFITFSTYVSLPKQQLNRYNLIIYDEAHHITDRCIEAIKSQNIKYSDQINILLSATIKSKHKDLLKQVFYNLYILKVDIKESIASNILPEPTILLLPLKLDRININQIYTKRKSCKKVVDCYFKDRWKFLKDKSFQVKIHCTEMEYYELLESDINLATMRCRESWRKQLTFHRLKWLSEIKTKIVNNILNTYLKNERVLTFCNSIEQCELLGKYPIHSRNKNLLNNLTKFNNNEINHITGVRMLDEGMNINNLRIGLFGNINASSIIISQRLGRILRHPKPIIIIPYYLGTREEEIVDNMKNNFNSEKIHTINYLNEINNYLK